VTGRLTEGFRDIIELRWEDFVAMELDGSLSNFDSVVAAVVRACKKGNLRAIQTALDRLDGKIAMELEVEYPKFYTRFPYAKIAADDPDIIDVPLVDKPHVEDEKFVTTGGADNLDELELQTEELPTGSLRAVLEKMLDSPKHIVDQILNQAEAVENGEEPSGPYVKSVIVAGLMKLVHDGRVSAVFEVFDQIDGKVAEKVKMLGSDMYITRYDEIAPAGAKKNADGIYQIEADNTTDVWAARLAAGQKKR
jgi:hypothetical protein